MWGGRGRAWPFAAAESRGCSVYTAAVSHGRVMEGRVLIDRSSHGRVTCCSPITALVPRNSSHFGLGASEFRKNESKPIGIAIAHRRSGFPHSGVVPAPAPRFSLHRSHPRPPPRPRRLALPGLPHAGVPRVTDWRAQMYFLTALVFSPHDSSANDTRRTASCSQVLCSCRARLRLAPVVQSPP